MKTENHPTLKELNVKICYLCDEELSGKIDYDHVIPNHFFRSEDKERPTLPVHKKCNNKKSKDDKWAVLCLYFMCSLNPDAEKSLVGFADIAYSELKDEYILGRSYKVKNLKLARTIFNEFSGGMEYILNNKHVIQLNKKPNAPSDTRLADYFKILCKGLYIRNIQGASFDKPKIKWYIYEHMKLQGLYDKNMQSVGRLFNTQPNTRFLQEWPGLTMYFGNYDTKRPNVAFVYVEFYQSVGVMAFFE